MLLRHSCCERYCSGYICNCTNSLSVTFPFAQLQFLQHQMQQQQMGMAVGAAAQAALPRQHSANQPRSKRKRSTPQPLPKSWPSAPPTNPSWGRQQTALCLIGSILRTDCGSTGLKLIFFFTFIGVQELPTWPQARRIDVLQRGHLEQRTLEYYRIF